MKHIILILSVAFASVSYAQTFDWYANFENIMDNREYDHSIGHDQTILGARIDVAIGLKQDSVSGVYGGVNYMLEYGGEMDSITPTLNLYYVIDREDFGFYAGSFPRNKVVQSPLFMISDTIRYYTPNMGGMAFEFRRKWGKQNIFVDWTGRQSATKRESFLAGFSGLYKHKIFYLENYGYMYHYALRSTYDPSEHIQDNGVATVYAGIDLSEKTACHILKCDIGAIGNYDRKRPEDIVFNTGIMGRANIHYQRFGVDVTSYWGDKLDLPLGDPLYRNGNYTRIDLCAVPIIKDHIESIFKYSLHVTGGVVSSSQQFFLIAKF